MSETRPRPGRIELHGWDAREQAWHGPDELTFTLRDSRQTLARMREVPGSWYGRPRFHLPGELPISFCVSVHDLQDAGLAVVDIEGSPGGPLHFVLVIPGRRRARLRPDFAFEFLAFLRLLEGPTSPGSELAIHDYIHRMVSAPGETSTLIFSIESHAAPPEAHHTILLEAGRLAMAMIAWMEEKDAKTR